MERTQLPCPTRTCLAVMLLGIDHVRSLAAGGLAVKAVFNGNGAIFFPASEQHRDQKAPGISYEDDYKGNALAATLASGCIEIRFHKSFSDAQVSALLTSLMSHADLAFLREWRATYQGRPLPLR